MIPHFHEGIRKKLDLSNDIFYFVKSVEYQDATVEVANPVIGIVKLR